MDNQLDDKTGEEHASAGNLMESKTSHLDDLLSEKLEKAFEQNTSHFVLHDIAKIASEHSPIDLAYVASRLPSNDRFVLYDNLSDLDAKIHFIINTDNNTRAAVLWHIGDEDIKKLIENMPPDEAVSVLEGMSERRSRRIIDLLEPNKAKKIKEIKKHQLNTAGRLMTTEFFSFTMDSTIGQAAEYIRNNPGIDLTRRIFVVNSQGQLQGYIPARNLIINPHSFPLKQVMRPILHKVNVDSLREEVVDIVERYKISALPVVEDGDVMVGVITYEDVIEAVEDIADETIARFAGTGEKVSEHDPMLKRFLSRSPWLLVTLMAGLINMWVMSTFQVHASFASTFVLFFVPLITGLSGNIGLQCSTVLVRSMATGAISVGSRTEAIIKEIIIGLSIGLLFGAIAGLVVYGVDFIGITGMMINPFVIGAIVGVGLWGACIAGTLLGVFSPLFFARIGVDPAIASGPIITAFNDFLSMSIYFLIALGLGALLL